MNHSHVVALSVVFVLLFLASIGLGVYKFHDCRNVGHSVLYCILDLG